MPKRAPKQESAVKPHKSIMGIILMIFAIYAFVHAVKLQWNTFSWDWTPILGYLIGFVFLTAAKKISGGSVC